MIEGRLLVSDSVVSEAEEEVNQGLAQAGIETKIHLREHRSEMFTVCFVIPTARIKLYDLFKCRHAAIVHIGCSEFDVAQRWDLEGIGCGFLHTRIVRALELG